ncbi:hypothetical protein [Spiroplasma diminutum]|uniref:Uncharacterized protein n=1 Tax=Spiroplasma diminutum CUAS-1 TaxID=1276221 RepID=S5ME46_9MOLU|nr:hypothetical protein [Spiroplasma diminutum]AGR41998.1 hypothetical protein SDIMI_v3c02940 [Spiroplasma diminutum CUAS-1]
MLKQIINTEQSNLAFTKMLNRNIHTDYKDIIYNFINQPQIKVEQKYDILFSQAIQKNCFKKVVKEMEKDFPKFYILWKLTEKISYWTNIFFSSKFESGNGLKTLQNILILKQLFLTQLRYNSNIWLKLNATQSEKIKVKKDKQNINYKLLLLIADFKDLKESLNLINEEQKTILELTLRSNNIEDYIELNNRLEINIFKYLPINILLLQSQMIKNSTKLNLKEKAKLSYSAFMQLLCIFVEENLSKKNLN